MTIEEWIHNESLKDALHRAEQRCDASFMWGYVAGGLMVSFVAYVLHGVGCF